MKYGVFAVVALCLTSACSKPAPQTGNEPSSAPPPASAANAGAAPAASIEPVPGFKLELATERAVSELRGDFNGDGVEDRLLVAKSASLPAGTVPANVNVVRPWPQEAEESAGDLTHGASVNFVIIHGQSAAQTPQVTVLHDDNSISLIDAPAAAELSVIKRPALASLDESHIAQVAKGDVLAVPTEAGIDTYIYWDGTTYRWFAPTEAE